MIARHFDREIYDFNPRPPRGGRRIFHYLQKLHPCNFNPRPPRGGRPHTPKSLTWNTNFNPRPPRGGRPPVKRLNFLRFYISIHAPREGGDQQTILRQGLDYTFQSTPPARGATKRFCTVFGPIRDFNPRPPRGGRRRMRICIFLT